MKQLLQQALVNVHDAILRGNSDGELLVMIDDALRDAKAQQEQPSIKDHEIAQLVNTLTKTAIDYRDAQQLRERISQLVVPVLKAKAQQEPCGCREGECETKKDKSCRMTLEIAECDGIPEWTPAIAVKNAIHNLCDNETRLLAYSHTPKQIADDLIVIANDLARCLSELEQEQPVSVDAYVGAREDAAIWKKRALEAEELNRKFIAELNGPTYLGEPVKQDQPAQVASATWTDIVAVNLVREGVNKHRARELAAHFLTLPTQPALSDEQILNCFYASKSEGMASYMLAVGRAIEAHCRGGNHG